MTILKYYHGTELRVSNIKMLVYISTLTENLMAMELVVFLNQVEMKTMI